LIEGKFTFTGLIQLGLPDAEPEEFYIQVTYGYQGNDQEQEYDLRISNVLAHNLSQEGGYTDITRLLSYDHKVRIATDIIQSVVESEQREASGERNEDQEFSFAVPYPGNLTDS